MNKVIIHEFAPGNNELVASENIKRGEIVGYIPEEMFLTSNHALSHSKNTEILRQNGQFEQLTSSEFIHLVLYLMEERRNPDSKWKDWFGILPKDWSEQTIFYTEEDLAWLKGSDFANYIRHFTQELEADYAFIARNIPDFSSHYSL